MGVVHLARQPDLDRLVVLKRMRRDLTADPSMVARFEREARAAAAVQHHHVVAVHDCFVHRGDHWIAQEFVDGIDLAEVLRRAGPLPSEVAARIALGVALGIEEVHSRGIVHRDLKPSNVLIGRGGEVKIADFGIAIERGGPGLTLPGTMLGSVPYMSPEQMMGEQVDHRTDLYSFGILLYEMLCGVPPFRTSEEGAPDTLLERMQRGRFDRPSTHGVSVPWWLTRLIRRCLRPKPSTRIQTFTEVRRRIERRVRATSPTACRRSIAAALVTRGALEPTEQGTVVSPVASAAPARSRRRIVLVAISAAVVASAAAIAWRAGMPGTTDAPRESAREVVAEVDSAPATEDATIPMLPAADGEVATTPDGGVVDGAEAALATAATLAPVPTSAPVPAELRFAVTPWARITVDDDPTFLTPRAAPLTLPPGRHRVVFEHPTLGRSEVVVDLAEGERRMLRRNLRGGGSS
jgi:serine/threonine-protein kinase